MAFYDAFSDYEKMFALVRVSSTVFIPSNILKRNRYIEQPAIKPHDTMLNLYAQNVP